MTNTTQIPASEVERIEKEAEQHPVYKRLITSNKLHAVIWSSGYRKGVVSEYLRRERERERQIEIAYCIGLLNRMLTMDELAVELLTTRDKINRLKQAFKRGDFMPVIPEPPSEP